MTMMITLLAIVLVVVAVQSTPIDIHQLQHAPVYTDLIRIESLREKRYKAGLPALKFHRPYLSNAVNPGYEPEGDYGDVSGWISGSLRSVAAVLCDAGDNRHTGTAIRRARRHRLVRSVGAGQELQASRVL